MVQIRSDQISCSVVSDSLRPHESQHARPPYPSTTPRVHSNSRPSSRWCHPAILFSVVSFSIPPSIRVFSNESTLHIRWPKYWSFSFSIIPSKEHPGLISWISLQSMRLSRVFSNTTVQKHQFVGAQLSSQSNSHIDTWPLDVMFISTYTNPAREQFLSGVTSSDVHRGLAGSRKMRHQPGGTCNELASTLLSKGAAATELQPAGACSCGNKAPCQYLPLFKRSKNYIFFLMGNLLSFTCWQQILKKYW